MAIYMWREYVAPNKWPAPSGFHVPLKSEYSSLISAMTTLGIGSTWDNLKTYFKMPCAWYRDQSTSNVYSQNSNWYYWCSDANGTYSNVLSDASSRISQTTRDRSYACSIRAFKDEPVIPTSSWTKLYWTSIESWWIFWSGADWLISLSSDWTNWITIADKNLWATTVYNSWDTLSEANCGCYYQRWNNYWFAWTWNVTKSSVGTKVNTTWYWPWNYYSSSTFMPQYLGDWSSVQNDNLRWWEDA